ncbi:MAG TPA: hypothetical protein VM935_11245, partial [Chitinophagaceae bacterium]|nr:hypothetical protein [Chitinophagaceae bacterium]
MRIILGYLAAYLSRSNKKYLFLTSLFTAVAIFINYHFGVEDRIVLMPYSARFGAWYLVFAAAFFVPYGLGFLFSRQLPKPQKFYFLLLIAPAIFAWKMAAPVSFTISANGVENSYWNKVLYWPVKLAVVTILVSIVWRIMKEEQPLYGMSSNKLHLRPYVIMLLIMLPLIAIASTQPDFLEVYPKLHNVSFFGSPSGQIAYKLLYELSYGS